MVFSVTYLIEILSSRVMDNGCFYQTEGRTPIILPCPQLEGKYQKVTIWDFFEFFSFNLYIKQEINYIPILHYVVLALQP